MKKKKLDFILNQSYLTPQEMVNILNQNDYIGQERAKKALCLMAYRHLGRVRKILKQEVPIEKLPSKENYLLIGPTGCGKTYLVELLFQKILEIPTVIIDITGFSETGYIGQDVPSILTRLIHAAEYDLDLAAIGIVCLDEFDKLSSGKNNAVFSGEGTTKDVSGIGVQRELLKMLESADIDVPYNLSHSTYGERITFNTAHIPFIACGAFSGFRYVLQSKEQNIGFGKEKKELNRGIATGLSREEVEKVANFESYGFMPELIGRFARIIPFEGLSRDDLRRILHENTIVKYKNELAVDGIKLTVDENVYELIVEKSLEKETGARSLKSYLVEYLEDACFEVYSYHQRQVRLFIENGEIAWEAS